jgi:hypothetical protein
MKMDRSFVVVLLFAVVVAVVAGQQMTTINIASSCNGNCAQSFGPMNNSTCPKLQAKLIASPFNCMNASCSMSLSISADSQNLNFSIYKDSNLCNAQCGGVFVPFDIVNELKTSTCCGFAPDHIKARTAVDYICSELYDKAW